MMLENNELNIYDADYFQKQIENVGLAYKEKLVGHPIPEDIIKSVSPNIAFSFNVFPLHIQEDGRLVLVTDTQNTFKQKNILEKELNRSIKILITDSENIREALNMYYSGQGLSEQMMLKYQQNLNDLSPLQTEINMLLQNAAKEKVSDIHILPQSNRLFIRFAIFGKLYDVSSNYNFPPSQISNVINLVKQMDTSGKMDPARTNMPNEGSFSIVYDGRELDMRMETLPNGNRGIDEYVNLRLLPQDDKTDQSLLKLDNIGYDKNDLEAIKRILFRNSTGLFICSGPTGCGKTTSIHAQINYVIEAFKEPFNVITINDPIEIQDERFTQVQLRTAAQEELSLTGKKIMKAALRCAPDILLCSEIRDEEDAKIALTSSLTGHRVFSTIHATNCVNTLFSRLLDLEISKRTLLSELRVIINQRLISYLCPYCSREHKLTEEEISILSQDEVTALQTGIDTGKFILKEKGSEEDIKNCGKCNHGVIGEHAIAEFIEFDTSLRDAFLSPTINFQGVKKELYKRGFLSLWQKGLAKVVKGKIELLELIRVVGKEL